MTYISDGKGCSNIDYGIQKAPHYPGIYDAACMLTINSIMSQHCFWLLLKVKESLRPALRRKIYRKFHIARQTRIAKKAICLSDDLVIASLIWLEMTSPSIRYDVNRSTPDIDVPMIMANYQTLIPGNTRSHAFANSRRHSETRQNKMTIYATQRWIN